jgi:hypothetical protein
MAPIRLCQPEQRWVFIPSRRSRYENRHCCVCDVCCRVCAGLSRSHPGSIALLITKNDKATSDQRQKVVEWLQQISETDWSPPSSSEPSSTEKKEFDKYNEKMVSAVPLSTRLDL